MGVYLSLSTHSPSLNTMSVSSCMYVRTRKGTANETKISDNIIENNSSSLYLLYLTSPVPSLCSFIYYSLPSLSTFPISHTFDYLCQSKVRSVEAVQCKDILSIPISSILSSVVEKGNTKVSIKVSEHGAQNFIPKTLSPFSHDTNFSNWQTYYLCLPPSPSFPPHVVQLEKEKNIY